MQRVYVMRAANSTQWLVLYHTVADNDVLMLFVRLHACICVKKNAAMMKCCGFTCSRTDMWRVSVCVCVA